MMAGMQIDLLMCEKLIRTVKSFFMSADNLKNFKQMSTSPELNALLKQKVEYYKESEDFKVHQKQQIDKIRKDSNNASMQNLIKFTCS